MPVPIREVVSAPAGPVVGQLPAEDQDFVGFELEHRVAGQHWQSQWHTAPASYSEETPVRDREKRRFESVPLAMPVPIREVVSAPAGPVVGQLPAEDQDFVGFELEHRVAGQHWQSQWHTAPVSNLEVKTAGGSHWNIMSRHQHLRTPAAK